MSNVAFEQDRAAAAGIDFCSKWPTAKAILQGLAGVISNFMAKMAITTVISAGDAYCGASASPSFAPAASQAALEFEQDRAAAAGIDFCSKWPTAKAILQGLAGVIGNFMAKMAITTVITAGDAYCGASSALAAPPSLTDRLTRAGLSIPPGVPPATVNALTTLSDSELATLAKIQREVRERGGAYDVGSGFF